ncbi:hypothetical protein AAHH80_32525, partial [Burkholderia pseudomallei]
VAVDLGLPAWLMNRNFGDWRWPRQETRSAWYCSVEVFHQATPDDGSGILDSIAERLALGVVSKPDA